MARVQTEMSISGVQQVVTGFNKAGSAAKQFAVRVGAAGAQTDKAAGRMAQASAIIDKHSDALDKAGSSMVKVGVATGAGIAAAVKASMDFEAAVSKVKATGGATAAELSQLRASSMSMATTFGVSGTQAMSAVEQLVKAGVSAKDVMGGGLQGALALAAAGEMNVGDAAESAASAMTQFGLSGKAVPHIADLFAQAANLAQGGARDISQAFANVGSVAAGAGLSIEQTTGFLGEMASNGHIGAEAGTQFKSMLLALQNPAGTAAKVMQKYGFEVNNSNGKMKSLDQIATAMHKSFDGLTEAQRNAAMAQIFGNYGIQAARDLYKGGAAGIDQWTHSVSKAGAAQAVAAGNLDNLKGDLTKFKAEWVNAAISLGSSSQSPLRGVVKDLTDLAGVVERNQQTVVTLAKMGIAVGGFGLALKGTVKAVSTAKTLSTLMTDLVAIGARTGTVTTSLSSSASAISGVGSAISGVGTKAAGAAGGASRFAGAITPAALGIPAAIVAIGALAAAWGAIHDAQHADQMNRAAGSAADWTKRLQTNSMDLESTMRSINDGGFGPTRQSLLGIGDALGHATGQTSGLERALDKVGEKLGNSATLGAQAKSQFSKFDTALSGLAASHDWTDVATGWQQITDAAAAQHISMSKVLPLFPQVQKQLGAVASQLGVTGLSAQDYSDWMGGKLPAAVNRAALANGVLAKSLGIIPTQTKKEVSVEVKGGSKKQIDELNAEILKVPANKQSQVALTAKTKGFGPAMAQAKDFEKQAANLQAVTNKGVKLEIKGGTAGQAKDLADGLKGLSKQAQIEVAVTAKTQGLDAAKVKLSQFRDQWSGATTEIGVKLQMKGATQQEVTKLRDDLNGLPKDTQVAIAATANTKGIDAAKAQLDQFLAATQGQHTVSMTMSVVENGAVKILDNVQVATQKINGVEVKIPVSDPGAVGAITALNGISYRVASLGGAKVLVPTSAPGAALAGQQIQTVTGKWQAINGKQIAIATSAPGAVGTKAQIDGVTGSWQRINGKVVFVATRAPGATTAKSQVDQLNSAAARTNGKHVQVTASANTGKARSALNALERPLFTTITVHTINTTSFRVQGGSGAGGKATMKGSANANGNLYERHDAQIARGGEWRVWAEPETQGEAYIPLAASKRPRSRMIAAETVSRLGGDVSWHASGSLSAKDVRAVQSRVVITADPTASLRSASNAAASALKNLNAVSRQTAPALKSTNAAFSRYARANTRANQLRDQKARYDAAMNVQISRASKSRAKELRTAKARTDAGYAQQITAAKQRAAALKKIYGARAKASKAASDKLKAAQQKVTDANKAAAEAQKELADSAAQAGKSLSESFRAGGSVSDWVSSMKEGASNLTAFNTRLLQLRKLGLSQANIDTLVGMGSGQGSEMAAEILKGGKNSVSALNKASSALDSIAKNLGLTTITAHASGAVHDATISSVPLFAEAGPEAFIPFNGSTRSREIWLESGRRLGILPMADGGAYVRRSSATTPLATIPPPVVQIDRLVLDMPGIGTAIDARVKAVQTSTARNVTRGSR